MRPGCPSLSAERIEYMKAEMASQWHIQDKPCPSWALSSHNAEIRQIKGRIAELTGRQETTYAGWEFDGGTAEANREDNRLQIFFEEKPGHGKGSSTTTLSIPLTVYPA